MKKYFRVKDIMDAAVQRAQEDPLFKQAEKDCPLDYHSISHSIRFDEVQLCSFSVIGHTEFGSNEGIYGSIQFFGEWKPHHLNDPYLSRMMVYTLKTLSEDKAAYLAMGAMVNLICYYANEFIGEHLDHFD